MADEPQAPLDARVRPAQAFIQNQNQNQNVELHRPDVDQPQVQPAYCCCPRCAGIISRSFALCPPERFLAMFSKFLAPMAGFFPSLPPRIVRLC